MDTCTDKSNYVHLFKIIKIQKKMVKLTHIWSSSLIGNILCLTPWADFTKRFIIFKRKICLQFTFIIEIYSPRISTNIKHKAVHVGILSYSFLNIFRQKSIDLTIGDNRVHLFAYSYCDDAETKSTFQQLSLKLFSATIFTGCLSIPQRGMRTNLLQSDCCK